MGSKSAIGIGNGICFKQVRDKGGGSYIDPLVRDSIVGLWKFDQNTNESPTRNIIKNTIKDKGGDLELLNFAYKANSGYNGYPEDFTSWNYNTGLIVSPTKVQNNGDAGRQLIYYHTSIRKEDVLEFKVKITLDEQSKIKYRYIKEDGTGTNIMYSESGTYTIPTSYFSKYTGENTWFGFEQLSGICTIEQPPLYEGALVTDGKDDMIVSQKTVQEMGITNKITVVSMIHQIGILSKYNRAFNNYIRNQNVGFIRNNIAGVGIDKTGIYGYTWNNSTKSIIENILGDKDDYSIETGNSVSIEGKFSVEGYIKNGSPEEINEVAVYWTFIANKVLTTDEINQIIAYYKLDKYVTPQVIYDIKRQGLTNDTPKADWYLKDFSGNGHDMQLYNFAKELGSGIGKYEADFNTWTPQSYVADSAYTSNKLHITNIKGSNAILYTNKGANAMKVKITGIQSFNLVYRYIAENDVWEALEVDRDGIYELPASTTTTKTYYTGFAVPYYTGDCDITIEQIPDYEGALVSDGIDDYGKVENLPIYKDYTVVADREIVDGLIDNANGGVAVRGTSISNGAFGFDYKNEVYSFATPNSKVIDVERFISYQSKYVNNGTNINAGNIVDANPLTIGKLGSSTDKYSKLALWSFLLFPYTLSEFLLERQLKKYKLGTLYPDMVEFRPIIKNNNQYRRIDFYTQSLDKEIYPGDHVPINSILRANIYLNNELNELQSFRINDVNVTFAKSSVDKTAYNIGNIPIAKSPQKIDIAIDEYIRFEDIIQPYPAIVNLSQDGKSITWGDKLKVGSEVTFVNHTNLLPDLYTVSGGVQYNGTSISWNTSIRVEKSMVFVNPHSYKKANEPNCILAPQTLRIPNSSYKILGYIPDLTGKGNHGRLNNFAYTEESGANEDGSIRFDGTDDHIIIPTLAHGGKCMLMKVNWNKDALMLYDQRRDNNPNSFAIYIPNFNNEDSVAYSSRNDGKTYIDGVLNTSVKGSQLKDVTHNITITNSNFNNDNTVSPAIGSDAKYNAFYAQMVLYEFMLLPDVPDEEEIKELNDVMGIEGGYVESPNYYYDAYGKKNTDTDRNLIADQVSKDVANALEVKNVAYNSESGYTDDNGLLLDGVEDHAINTVIPAVTDFTVIAKRTDLRIIDDLTSSFIQKGLSAVWDEGGAFSEGRTEDDKQYCSTFGNTNDISDVYNKEFFYETKNSYNGKAITIGTDKTDSNGLSIGAVMNNGSALGGYWKGVFYKLMFYTKTIDQLSINMLKNLFERDELIDITNPIFKKKEL